MLSDFVAPGFAARVTNEHGNAPSFTNVEDAHQIVVRRRRLVIFLVIVAILLAAASVASRFAVQAIDRDAHTGLVALLDRFDFNGEMNLPSWFSSITLAIAAMLLALIAELERRAADKSRWQWIV